MQDATEGRGFDDDDDDDDGDDKVGNGDGDLPGDTDVVVWFSNGDGVLDFVLDFDFVNDTVGDNAFVFPDDDIDDKLCDVEGDDELVLTGNKVGEFTVVKIGDFIFVFVIGFLSGSFVLEEEEEVETEVEEEEDEDD